MTRVHAQRWGIAAALLAAALGLFHKALLDPRYAIPYDLQDYHFPLAWQIAEGLSQGRLALWDPFTYCGFPLHANVQAQMFYPGAWPVFLAGAAWGADRVRGLLEWQVALHVWLAGVLAYGLGRRLGLQRSSALLAALGFELSGFFVAQAQHLGAVCGAAWIPLAWRAVVELNERLSARRVGVLAVALAMPFLAGFPAVTLVAFASTGLLALVLWLRQPSRWQPFLLSGAGAAWAVALCAVQLLPTLELTSLSKAYQRGAVSADGGGVPWQGLVSLIAPGRLGVLDSVAPKFGVNPSFLYLYAGLAVVLFALVGLARRSAWRVPLATMTILHVFWLLGTNTPIWRVIYGNLPVSMRSAVYPEFTAAAFLLALCLLAGLGFEQIAAGRGRWATGLVIVAAALDPAARAWGSWFVASPSENTLVVSRTVFEESRESLKAAHRAVGQAAPPGRMETFRDSLRWMIHGPVLGIATPNGSDPLAMERVVEVRRLYAPMEDWLRTSEARALPSRVMDMLNVTALVAWDDQDVAPPKEHYTLLETSDGHRFYANPAALPRFFLTGRVVASSSMAQTLAVLKSREFDPAETAVVEGDAPQAKQAEFSAVRVLSYAPEEVELEYDSPVDAVLVSSEAAHPGWRATLDGRQVPLLLVNGAFRGLAAPPGRHRVEMRYRSRTLLLGAAGSVAALAGLIAAWRRR